MSPTSYQAAPPRTSILTTVNEAGQTSSLYISVCSGVCRKMATPTMVFTQKSSFSPNCICREVVAVVVMTPAVGDGAEEADEYTTVLGVPKLV